MNALFVIDLRDMGLDSMRDDNKRFGNFRAGSAVCQRGFLAGKKTLLSFFKIDLRVTHTPFLHRNGPKNNEDKETALA
jgi:hypothetical protein